MIKDILLGNIPKGVDVSQIDLSTPNWSILQRLWHQNSIHFSYTEDPVGGKSWEIYEAIGRYEFHMLRSMLSMNRTTLKDDCGLLGLSLINLQDQRVILTEGVSDYFTAKLYNPTMNVLGVTTLSGSHNAKVILLNLFDNFIICSDNDSLSERNTGVMNSLRFKQFLESYGKKVKVMTPDPPHKDITDNFIFNLKLAKFI